MKIRWHDGYWQVRDADGRVLYETLSAQMASEWMAEQKGERVAA